MLGIEKVLTSLGFKNWGLEELGSSPAGAQLANFTCTGGAFSKEVYSGHPDAGNQRHEEQQETRNSETTKPSGFRFPREGQYQREACRNQCVRA